MSKPILSWKMTDEQFQGLEFFRLEATTQMTISGEYALRLIATDRDSDTEVIIGMTQEQLASFRRFLFEVAKD